MKNVIILTIDALSKKILDSYPFPDELFINKIREDSLEFTNMYTQGPFTEASINALVCVARTLDYGGYFMRVRNAQSIFVKSL